MTPHFMLIQACYTSPELSRKRLAIAGTTSAACLTYQTSKPIVRIVQRPDDPHATERLELYRATGCEIVPLWRDTWKLYGEDWELPEGRKLVSRIDDDDVISSDYCQRTFEAAPRSGEWSLYWPNGYVFWNERIFRLSHTGTQFLSLVTDRQTDPHQDKHFLYRATWRTKSVCDLPGWIWVRHGIASTSTLPKYRRKQVGRIDAARIPINLRAILRAIEPFGNASANYTEHRELTDAH